MFYGIKTLTPKIISAIFAVAVISLAFGSSSASASAFAQKVLGSWGGNGIFELKNGKKERIRCTAYYTGNNSQLKMNIRCQGNQKIEMRSKMSIAAGKITGSWLETTFNAVGNISGKVDPKRIKLKIDGAVSGFLEVRYSKRRQQVTINTSGTDLKVVKITLTRR